MQPLLKVVKDRRLALGLKQHDLTPLVGMSRQQYQRLESKGNPRLSTLEQIAAGLKCSLLLIPEEKLQAVLKAINTATPTEVEPAPVELVEPKKRVKRKKKVLPEELPKQRSLWD